MIYKIFIFLNLLNYLTALDIIQEFRPAGIKKFTNGTNFTTILIRENSVYVGAKDYLYKFDAINIANINSPNFAYSYLPANPEQKEQCMLTYYDENLCNNFIKAILNRQTNNDLYVCGSYAFTPRLFQLTYDLNLIKEDDGYGYCSLNPLDSSTSLWIDQGNPLNIPSLYSGALLDASTKTQPVEPVIYRPELKRSDKAFPYLRTPKFDSDWLYQPTFIASFEVDEYVLFFLKEKSIEQIAENQDVYYSRVIRLCKNDAGSFNLGNQWSSMRKARLTCIYNNTYLNNLEDIIQLNNDVFIGVFSMKLPTHSVSFLCEFKKQGILSALNTNSFKEVVPGTQYWSKITIDKIPKGLPSQCDYNSQILKDDVSNFIKAHPLVSDHIEGNYLNFIDKQVNKIAVDVIKTVENVKINVYYLATNDGKIIKFVDLLDNKNLIQVSQWKVSNEPIEEIEIKKGQFVYVTTNNGVYQVPLVQCNRYNLCSSCMMDPYCGFNVRKGICEDVKSNANLVSLNTNICTRLFNTKNENTKVIQAEIDGNLNLNCGGISDDNDNNLSNYIEWKKDKVPITQTKNSNIIITASKDLVILNGNSSLNGVYSCVIDNEVIISYSVTFKQTSASSKTQLISGNQQCITAENYIRQYNNWCDELSRYQRALNEWEDLKDKTCGAPNDRH